MPFSFNFQVESESSSHLAACEESSKDKSPVSWIDSREHLIEDGHLDKITTERIDSYSVSRDETLNIVNSDVVTHLLTQSGYEGDLSPALAVNNTATDLVPGQYEGGLKIWECSEDLVSFLTQTRVAGLEGRRVLELGCGAALPGLLAFKHGAAGGQAAH